MSWSVNLSGPPNVVTRELADLLLLADKALDYAANADSDTVTVGLGGFVSWDEENEIINSGVSMNFGEANTLKV